MSIQIARGIEEWQRLHSAAGAPLRTALAIGNFDGVHAGHQAILRRVIESARVSGALATAVTFDPHPLKILRPEHAPALLSTLEQRLEWMKQLGIEAVLVLPFTMELARVSAEDFAEGTLAGALHAERIFVGHNFRFGHRHAGDVALLERLAGRFGYGVEIMAPVELDGEIVSSTGVRRAVTEGRMDAASRLLGRPYSLTGRVAAGDGRGSREVVPTLNLVPEQEVLPARGVYATETRIANGWQASATNVGVRPTFNGTGVTVETNLLDATGNVKAEMIEVRFWKWLRGEKKFASAEELRKQIGEDVKQVRGFLGQMRSERRTV